MLLPAMGFSITNSDDPDVLRKVFIESDMLDRYMAVLLEDEPGIVEARWDPASHLFIIFWDWPITIANVARNLGDNRLVTEYALKCVDTGVVRLALTYLRAFAALPDASHAVPTFGCVLNLLERTGLAEGGAQMVLAEAQRCGSSAKELHASLMDVVSRGHEIPKVSTTIISGRFPRIQP